MAKIHCKERVVEYTNEFKVKVVELTQELDVQAIDIANILNLHPMVVYRWRQEYREGKLLDEPSRRIIGWALGAISTRSLYARHC